MKHAASKALFAYWNSIRGLHAAPDSAALEPAAIGSILADTFLADIEPDHEARAPLLRVRLSGTRLNALAGCDLAGRDLLSLWRPEDRDRLDALLMAVVEECRVVVVGCVAQPLGEAAARLEVVFLPLRHRGRTDRQMLGAVSAREIPAWLGLKPIGPLELWSDRVVDPLDLSPLGTLLGQRPSADRLSLTVYEGGVARPIERRA